MHNNQLTPISVEFYGSTIDSVIAKNKYVGDVLLTINGNETHLRFNNGYVTKGKVINPKESGDIVVMLDSSAFSKNFTKYRIELKDDRAKIFGRSMRLNNYIY